MKTKPAKILIVKLHAIGDFVIATPAFRHIRNGFPDAQIDLLTFSWTKPASMNNSSFDKVVGIDSKLFVKPRLTEIQGLLSLARNLRSQNYDAAIIFHRHPMIRRFIKFIGIAPIFSFDDPLGMGVPLFEEHHSVLTAWNLASFAVENLGGMQYDMPDIEEISYEWHVTDDENQKAEKISNQLGLIKTEFVAVFPGGASNPYIEDLVRRWSPENYGLLCKAIEQELGLNPVLFGGNGDKEVCRIVTKYFGKNIIDMSGQFSLRVVGALIARAGLVVTNDSAPLHISAAVGVKTVGVFGPTGVDLKLPPGKNTIAASIRIPCSPCYFSTFKACIFDKIRCMEELTPEHVMRSIHLILQSSDSTA